MPDFSQTYNAKASILKGILIILVVIGHCESPAWLTQYIYLFHMPAFFFISGYLFKETYADNLKVLFKRSVCTLYIPFVFWSILFYSLTNIFNDLHILDYRLTTQEFLLSCFKALTLRGHQPLLNAFWFLKTMFLCRLLVGGILHFIKKDRWIIILISVILACCCKFIPFDATMVSRLLMAIAFFMSGFLIKKYSEFKCVSIKLSFGLFAMLLLVFISLFYKGSMFSTGIDALFYYPVGMLGTIGIFTIASNISSRLLEHLGIESMSIFTFHFLAFKLASLIKIAIYNLPIEKLAQNPVIHDNNESFWITYAIIGIIVPFMISKTKRLFPVTKIRLL